jgi:hypothetical protein
MEDLRLASGIAKGVWRWAGKEKYRRRKVRIHWHGIHRHGMPDHKSTSILECQECPGVPVTNWWTAVYIITLLSGFRQRDGGSQKINHPLFHDEFQIVVLGLNKGEPGERAEQDKSEH